MSTAGRGDEGAGPWRAMLLGGLLYGLPFGIWLLAGLEPGPSVPDLLPAHRALLWSQALALVLLLPAVAGPSWSQVTLALVLLQALPWPLLALLYRTGSVPLDGILAAQALLLLAVPVLAGVWHLLGRVAISWQLVARAALQGALLLGLLAGLGPLAGGIGL